jgi:hypothetical protein
MARIATVYNNWNKRFEPVDMGYIRWLAVSSALADRGHEVDMAAPPRALNRKWWQRGRSVQMSERLRMVILSDVRWADYDVVKTFYHEGFNTLERFGGTSHPFVISHLGSVVGRRDMEGIYFYGKVRETLYATQERVARTSHYVTFVSAPAKQLFQDLHGTTQPLVVVPGAAERVVPPPGKDPFPKDRRLRCIFAGHVYTKDSQPEANAVLLDKLNELGRHLGKFDVRLYMIGSGDLKLLDQNYVTYLGAQPYERSWDYFHFANVGTVVTYGKYHHNNESTKIYYYLRMGLPTVSERGFPNDDVVEASGLGFTVENGNMELMAQKISEAAQTKWDREKAVQSALEKHTWYQRVAFHDKLIRSKFGG